MDEALDYAARTPPGRVGFFVTLACVWQVLSCPVTYGLGLWAMEHFEIGSGGATLLFLCLPLIVDVILALIAVGMVVREGGSRQFWRTATIFGYCLLCWPIAGWIALFYGVSHC